jgi:hypothetical protein
LTKFFETQVFRALRCTGERTARVHADARERITEERAPLFQQRTMLTV